MDVQLRRAGLHDVPALAAMNRQLIEDEVSRNPMTLAELEARMRGWVEGAWTVLLILVAGEVAGYALYQERRDEYSPEHVEVYLRQFFIRRDRRGRGIGRAALERILAGWLPAGATVTVDVLATNPGGLAFWQRVGFAPYCTAMTREVP